MLPSMSAAEREREDRRLWELKKQTTRNSQSLGAQIQKVWVISLLFRYRNTVPERKKHSGATPAMSLRYDVTIYIMLDVHLIFYHTALTKHLISIQWLDYADHFPPADSPCSSTYPLKKKHQKSSYLLTFVHGLPTSIEKHQQDLATE